ncbi:hypothetical protein [Ekhidna sp.]
MSCYILVGKLDIKNDQTFLYIRTIFSKILLIFLLIWFGFILGLSLYFFVQKDYAESSILLGFGFFSSIIITINILYTKKRDVQLIKKELKELIDE